MKRNVAQTSSLTWSAASERHPPDLDSVVTRLRAKVGTELSGEDVQRIIETLERQVTPQKAFELGWRAAADWAKRDDLVSDIGSPAYVRDVNEALAKVSRPCGMSIDAFQRLVQILANQTWVRYYLHMMPGHMVLEVVQVKEASPPDTLHKELLERGFTALECAQSFPGFCIYRWAVKRTDLSFG